MPRQAAARAEEHWNPDRPTAPPVGARAPAGERAPEYGPDTPVETATEARQGVIEYNVSTVLIVSTTAVIIAFAVIYAVFFA